jgi:hypothetical protein
MSTHHIVLRSKFVHLLTDTDIRRSVSKLGHSSFGFLFPEAQRDRDYQFDASESGGPAPPYMQQPAHQQYGQPPPQIQPMLLQVAPAYGSGIAGQQGYQHQQPGTSYQDQRQIL